MSFIELRQAPGYTAHTATRSNLSTPMAEYWGNVAVILIGFITGIGIISNKPILYTWGGYNVATMIQMSFSFVLLGISQILQLAFHWKNRWILLAILSFCYLLPFTFGLSEIGSFIRTGPNLNWYAFFVPPSPIQGHMPLYDTVGLILATLASVFYLCARYIPRLPNMIGMIITILLVNISVYGLIDIYGANSIFHYVMSIPSGVGLIVYGLTLLYTAASKTNLPKAIHYPKIRLYAALLVCFWVISTLWRGVWGNWAVINKLGMNILVNHYIIWNDLFEILLTSLVLAFGLGMLETMGQYNLVAQELQTTNERLQVSIKRNSMLAATLSHDLKGPIQSERTAVEMLKTGQFGEKISDNQVQDMLSAVIEGNQFELELVSNLVELLRYDIHEERFSPRPFEINTLMAEIEKELQPLSQSKGVALHFHPMVQPKQLIIADPTALKRVLHNLIINAIQHLAPGHHADINVEPQQKDFLFTIKDDGPGLPPDIQQTWFQFLSQGEGRPSTLGKSGLGLYITRQIIQKHGGEIGVDSAPGHGTTFHFTIPKETAPFTNTAV